MTAKAKTTTHENPKQERSAKDPQKQLEFELAFPASDPLFVTRRIQRIPEWVIWFMLCG